MAAKSDTWMPLYVADYLRDTMRLTRDQHGGYMLLIMAAWTEGGRLPNDPDELAAIVKATPSEWRKMAPVLLRYFEVDGDHLVHTRVVEEHEKAARLAEARRQNGVKGGRPRKPPETEPITEKKPVGLASQKLIETPSPLPTEVEANASTSADGMSNDILVGSGDPTPVGDDLFGGDQGKPAKPRLVPTKAELDAIWEITPSLGRERSSRKDLERALTAAMRRGHEPAAVLAGIRAAYASKSYSGDSAKGVHRLIEADRWQTFVELARPASAAPVATWRGPRQVRDAVVAHAGEDFARGWLDAATWRPAPDRAVLARNSFIASRLEREVGPMLRAMGVSIEVAQGVAA